jgi:hypothetical protein
MEYGLRVLQFRGLSLLSGASQLFRRMSSCFCSSAESRELRARSSMSIMSLGAMVMGCEWMDEEEEGTCRNQQKEGLCKLESTLRKASQSMRPTLSKALETRLSRDMQPITTKGTYLHSAAVPEPHLHSRPARPKPHVSCSGDELMYTTLSS